MRVVVCTTQFEILWTFFNTTLNITNTLFHFTCDIFQNKGTACNFIYFIFFSYSLVYFHHKHNNIQFNENHPIYVQYLLDAVKHQQKRLCLGYLNDNSKVMTIKMIPYKYVLFPGFSLEQWNIARSASSWFWFSLQDISCLYSCVHI